MKDEFVMGDHLVICDMTGFKVHASQTRMTWDGRRVRKESWEPRHPQDYLRSRAEDTSVENPRPEQPDVFIQTDFGIPPDELVIRGYAPTVT